MKKESKLWGELWTLSDTSSRGLHVLFVKPGMEIVLTSEEEDVRCFTIIRGTVEVRVGEVTRRVASPGEEHVIGAGSSAIFRIPGEAEIIEERLSLPDVPSGEE